MILEMRVSSSLFTIPGKYLRQLLPVLLLLAFISCRKQDISPEPVGEAVPYDGPTSLLKDVLAKSPYTFFNTAWKRAGMDAHLDLIGTNAFTLFVPTDKAFQDAGWTLDKINKTTPGALDTLLSYYITTGHYSPTAFAKMTGNMSLYTLLQSGDLPNYSADAPYKYMLFAGVHKDSLVINGLSVSKWGNALESMTAAIYPLDKFLPLPQLDMLGFLQADGRFSFYLEACRINDSLYLDQFPWDNVLLNLPLLTSQPMTGGQFTLFAPTDNAFRKQGFNSIEDIRNYATRSLPIGDPYNNEMGYFVYPTTAMDSLLLPNRLDYVGVGGPSNGGPLVTNPVYYANELQDNPGISGLVLLLGSIGSSAAHIIRLDISNSTGNVLIKRLGATAPRLPIAQKDVQVLNGVIHVIDEGLFMP
jgi:uncharacterized surface protein with fasciclin (FAS1) repeats